MTQASTIHYIEYTSIYRVIVDSMFYVRMRHDATRTMSMKMAVRLPAGKTIANMMQQEDQRAS